MTTENTTNYRTASIDVSGDILTVNWTGSVWQDCVGGQHAYASDALDVDLYHYLCDCGMSNEYTEESINEYEIEFAD